MPVVIVTGSDSGIGRATAVALARDGFALGVTWHRDEAGARETAREIESATSPGRTGARHSRWISTGPSSARRGPRHG